MFTKDWVVNPARAIKLHRCGVTTGAGAIKASYEETDSWTLVKCLNPTEHQLDSQINTEGCNFLPIKSFTFFPWNTAIRLELIGRSSC